MSPSRVHQRVALAIQVEFRNAGAFLVAYSANLSKGGMFLETNNPLPPDTEIALRFAVPGVGSVDVPSIVAWVRDDGSPGLPLGMGIRFVDPDDRFANIVDDIVAVFRGLRLLVVAPTAQSRTLLTRAVRSVLAAAEVVEAGTALEAQTGFAREPDLAVVDLDEGEGAGMEVIRLAKTTTTPLLPVIALSRDEGQREEALRAGADEVIPSAVVNAELPAAVLRVIGRPTRFRAM